MTLSENVTVLEASLDPRLEIRKHFLCCPTCSVDCSLTNAVCFDYCSNMFLCCSLEVRVLSLMYSTSFTVELLYSVETRSSNGLERIEKTRYTKNVSNWNIL